VKFHTVIFDKERSTGVYVELREEALNLISDQKMCFNESAKAARADPAV